MTNIAALQNLYAALGGDPDDVANCTLIVEVLNAISAKFGGRSDAVLNPEALNNVAAVIGGAVCGPEYAALIDRSIADAVVPYGVTKIGDSVFRGCTNLRTVTIPETVTTIGVSAFTNCALESLVIPEGVTTIGTGAFYTCNALQSVYLPSSITSIGSIAFGNIRPSGTLYCRFSEGAVAGAPWGARNVVYDYND